MNPEFWTSLKAKASVDEITEYLDEYGAGPKFREMLESRFRQMDEKVASGDPRGAVVLAFRLGQITMAKAMRSRLAPLLITKNAGRILRGIARKGGSKSKRQVIQEVWGEFDLADIKKLSKLKAYKVTGEIAAKRLGLEKPIPVETVRKYIS